MTELTLLRTFQLRMFQSLQFVLFTISVSVAHVYGNDPCDSEPCFPGSGFVMQRVATLAVCGSDGQTCKPYF